MAGGRQTLHSERFCGRSNGRIKPIVPDAASVMSGGFAQIVTFAKLGPFPDSGPSCRLRRTAAESPNLELVLHAACARSVKNAALA